LQNWRRKRKQLDRASAKTGWVAVSGMMNVLSRSPIHLRRRCYPTATDHATLTRDSTRQVGALQDAIMALKDERDRALGLQQETRPA